MDILFGSLAGFVFGSIFSVINFFLLKKVVEAVVDTPEAQKAKSNKVLKMYLLRIALDFVALCSVFILKDYLPFDWFYVIAGTAIGLTIPGQVLSVLTKSK